MSYQLRSTAIGQQWPIGLPIPYDSSLWGQKQTECRSLLGDNYVGCYYFELVDNIVRALDNLDALIQSLQSQLVVAQSQQETTETQKVASASQIAALEQEIARLRQELESGNTNVAAAQDAIALLQNQLEVEEKRYSALVVERDFLKELGEQLTRQLYDLQQRLDRMMQLGQQVLQPTAPVSSSSASKRKAPEQGEITMATWSYAEQLNELLQKRPLIYREEYLLDQDIYVQKLVDEALVSAANFVYVSIPYKDFIPFLYTLFMLGWQNAAESEDGIYPPIDSWQQAYNYSYLNRIQAFELSPTIVGGQMGADIETALKACESTYNERTADNFPLCPLAVATNQILTMLMNEQYSSPGRTSSRPPTGDSDLSPSRRESRDSSPKEKRGTRRAITPATPPPLTSRGGSRSPLPLPPVE